MAEHSTLVGLLGMRAQEYGEAPAFIFRSRDNDRFELSWSRMYHLAGRFAARLHSRGLGRGQRVVNTLVNSPERVVCEAGIWMSGAASVNGHCQMADGSDLLHIIRVSRASAVLVDPDVTSSPWRVLNKHVGLGDGAGGGEDIVTSATLDNLNRLFFIRRVEGGDGVEEDFITSLEAQRDWFQADDITADDILSVFTTSGTTGFSKLLIYSHADIIQPIVAAQKGQLKDAKKALEENRFFKTAPFGWVGGFVGNGVVDGTICVTCDVRVEGIPKDMPEFISKVIEEEKCCAALIAPMYLPGVLRQNQIRHEKSDAVPDPQTSAANKMKYIVLGGMPVTRAMVEVALSLAHVAIIAYGATDFLLVSALTVWDSASYVDCDTGPPVEGVTVKIVSQDDEDKVLPANQVGNILIKGTKNAPQYIADPEAEEVITYTKDGFFRTLDVGRLDERGHLIVNGRGSDAIMRGPYIFYPTWIEACIKACPGVRDVIVIGIPDPVLNEELCACVVLDSGSVTVEQVRDYVEKVVVTSEDDPLSPRPRYYLQFQSFPMTDSGKPKRKLIKAQAADRILTTA